ncbi:Pectinesterase protein [Dioscorea alata]|uniref:Pectinesterase protein n=1 Tax=Dioscorea alata TaxID=55571 RepID=A0ACB7VZ67_DIOAL|nr:Pectinesterase protein [Dioscorea alata]
MPSHHLLFLLFLFASSFTFTLVDAKAPGPAPRLTSKSTTALELAARYAAAGSLSASNASVALKLIPAQCLTGQVQDCVVLLDHSASQLGRAYQVLARISSDPVHKPELDDAATWASAALTDLTTCLQAVRSMGQCSSSREKLVRSLDEASRHTSNALHFISRVKG